MKKITFAYLPENYEQFCALEQMQDRTKPENACALFLAALHVLTKNKADGYAAVNALRGPRPLSRFEEQFLWDRLYDKLYLPLVYFDGASPANNYTPAQPYTVTLHDDPRPQDMQPGYMRKSVRRGKVRLTDIQVIDLLAGLLGSHGERMEFPHGRGLTAVGIDRYLHNIPPPAKRRRIFFRIRESGEGAWGSGR